VDWNEVYRIASLRGWRDGLNTSLLLCTYQEQALYGESSTPQALLERARSELPGWIKSRLDRQLGEGALMGLCQGEQWTGKDWRRDIPLRIPFVFSKYFFYAKLVRDPSRAPVQKIKDVAVHTGNGTKLRLRIHSQPNMLVTLSGVDGCGKTTHARALTTAFETCHLRADYVWTRAGSARWLSALTRLLGGHRKAAATQPAEKVELRRQRFQSPLLRWGWSWLTTLELVSEYARKVAWPLIRGHVVICDRYVYDAWVDLAANSGRPAEGTLPARVLGWLSPRPALSYWLDVPAEAAHSRAQDALSEEFMASQAAAYQRVAQAHHLRRVDTQREVAENNDALVFEVLSTYFARYWTLVNQLFLKNPGQWK
jgi:thymidylate kinase